MTVADPGYPGAPTPEVGAPAYYIANFFAENCIKYLKGREGSVSLAPPLIYAKINLDRKGRSYFIPSVWSQEPVMFYPH